MDLLAEMEPDSVDGCVTDPPYHLQSIVHRFGNSNANNTKHGGYKRLSTGFLGQRWDGGDVAHNPDTWAAVLRVLKPGAYLTAFAGTRTYHRMACAVEDAGFEIRDMVCWLHSQGFPKSKNDGALGTALKPAVEPLVLAQKPREGTYAGNHAKHGCGYLNIDEARVPVPTGDIATKRSSFDGHYNMFGYGGKFPKTAHEAGGRWPANVVHDGSDEVVDEFPHTDATNEKPRVLRLNELRQQGRMGLTRKNPARLMLRGDVPGSAARYFYCAKPRQRERSMGLDERCKHPTMKPVELMRWLVRLAVPQGGVVLDPFLGSGTTAIAAGLEGRRCVGIERDPDYAAIAEQRVKWWAGRRGTVADILNAAPKPDKAAENHADLFGASQ